MVNVFFHFHWISLILFEILKYIYLCVFCILYFVCELWMWIDIEIYNIQFQHFIHSILICAIVFDGSLSLFILHNFRFISIQSSTKNDDNNNKKKKENAEHWGVERETFCLSLSIPFNKHSFFICTNIYTYWRIKVSPRQNRTRIELAK